MESAVARLHETLDAALETLVLLAPDTATWEVPAGTVDRAFYTDERFARAHRRVREILDRLRDSIPERYHEDVDDVDSAARRAMHDAATVGWRLGIAMSMSRRTTEAA